MKNKDIDETTYYQDRIEYLKNKSKFCMCIIFLLFIVILLYVILFR
jgi:hypothetical protein